MQIMLFGKSLDVRLSAAADRALQQRAQPLGVEMELLFSCLLRKRVRFGEAAPDAVLAGPLALRFKPVMTRKCTVAEGGASPPSEHFPLENPRPYVPNWLTIDYRRGEWVGNFGYADDTA